MHPVARLCLPVIALLLLSACASSPRLATVPDYEPHSAALRVEQPERLWWQLRFRLVWPEDEAPDFAAHLLIADQLLLPVLVEHEARMPLWRIHRRAGRGDAGNQLSLIFFSDAVTAHSIEQAVATDPLTQWLLDKALIDRVLFAQRSPEELATLELTSDPEWPLQIQRSWPWFAMGASQTWLLLVNELSAGQIPAGHVDFAALLAHYRDVDAQLNAQWRQFGQHAYLHHLNAIFGYQPLMIRSHALKTF